MSTQTGSITEGKHNNVNIKIFWVCSQFSLIKQVEAQSCVVSVER